jgi:hypothetical protein
MTEMSLVIIDMALAYLQSRGTKRVRVQNKRSISKHENKHHVIASVQ